MKNSSPVDVCFNALTYLVAFADLEQVLKVISLILSIITSILILVKSIVKWYKKASADGKITADEINEGIDILQEGVEDIKKKGDKK